jgi:site-specific DNA recombinase
MTLRMGIYTRLSHDATGQQTATARQEKACRQFAALRGWQVVEVYEDVDVSAFQKGVVRPAYERMLTAIKDGHLDGGLVWKLDRLVRRPSEFERFWQVCEQSGAIIASATEPIDASTDLGLALVRILVTFAQLESATISLRIKAKHRELAEAGRPNGPAPFGWRPGMQDLEPTEAELLREATRRALSGEPMRAIASDWYDRGIRTRQGKVFWPDKIKHALLSEYAVGDRIYHGEIVATDCFAPLMTRQEQAVLRATLSTRPGGSSFHGCQYALTGLLRCGRCGARLFGLTNKGRHTYTCSTKFGNGCNGLTIAGAPLEAHLYDALVTHLRSQPPTPPPVVDGETVSTVLDDFAAELRALARRTDLTRGQYGALQARIIGSLQQRTGLVLIDGRPVHSGYHTAKSLEESWSDLSTDDKRAIFATHLHYVVVLRGARGPVFRPERVAPVFWTTEARPGERLRRIAARWANTAPPRPARRTVGRRTWTDESALAALRAWTEATGLTSGSKYALSQRSHAHLPSLTTLIRRFGSWPAALERCGRPNNCVSTHRFNDREIATALRIWLDHGGDGRSASYSEHARALALPSFATVTAHFGTWRAAMAAVGGSAAGRRWTPHEVRAALMSWLDDTPSEPHTSAAYRHAALHRSDLPSLPTVVAKFGSWSSAVSAALSEPGPQAPRPSATVARLP